MHLHAHVYGSSLVKTLPMHAAAHLGEIMSWERESCDGIRETGSSKAHLWEGGHRLWGDVRRGVGAQAVKADAR